MFSFQDLVATEKELPGVINRNVSIAFAESPKEVLPTVEDIDAMDRKESAERMHYFTSLFILTYVATVLLGTCIMTLVPKCGRCCGGSSNGWQQMVVMKATPEDAADSRPAWKIREDREDEIENRQGPQRWLVTVVFSAVFCASLAAATFSLLTDRLSKRFGVDWEIYFVLFALNCSWLLSQAIAAAARAARAGSTFAPTAFFEGTVTGTFPLIADAYDTLKDVLVGALCIHSDHIFLQGVGVLSWIYLAAIHLVFLGWFPMVKGKVSTYPYLSWWIEDMVGVKFLSKEMAEQFLTEMLASYAPLMVCPTASKQARQVVEDGESSCLWKMWLQLSKSFNGTMDALSGIAYKQVTPIKRSLLAIENIFQGMVGIAYMAIEGGSIFVAVLNVVIPILQILLAFFLHKPLRRKAARWFAKRLKLALENEDLVMEQQMRSEAFEDLEIFAAVAPHLSSCEDFTELTLDFLGHRIDDAGAAKLAVALEQLQLKNLDLGLQFNAIGDAGAVALAEAIGRLPQLESVVVALRGNFLEDEGETALDQLQEELRSRCAKVDIAL